eukprot:TRINITY_DN1564_c0_g1_i9.p1 TRINITY_DN1564_c0_g1~~TRINITY_DN1564_c0_g1_i9.p1  ORF type:complete len:131 (-),score=20.38 TRINITY_DN1564_c0_g1_i9:257-649(-)
MTHNTHLLDIKPFHQLADSPWGEVRQPRWVGGIPTKPIAVSFTNMAKTMITESCSAGTLEFWSGPEDVENLLLSISDLLSLQDVRSRWTMREGSNTEFTMVFDNLLLQLVYDESGCGVTVVGVTLVESGR